MLVSLMRADLDYTLVQLDTTCKSCAETQTAMEVAVTAVTYLQGLQRSPLMVLVTLVQAGWYIALFCLCGAVGQLFIFATIRTFGSLVNTLICTTRKFFNILLSVLWNGNPLLPQQWLAVVFVFAGLLTSSIAKSGKKKVELEVQKAQNKSQ